MTSRTKAALLASALVVMPGMALAQTEGSQEVNAQAQTVEQTAEQLQQEANALSTVVAEEQGIDDTAAARDERDDRGDGDDNSGRWGLLGLLGLAGLLGLKRRDDDHDRRDHRTTTGTGGTHAGTDTRL
ncbi:MAG: hypothetical protein M3438_03370 [Pseudomonadota bacterium]|nr:hypothetical protein [Pseudomonadota bacterium]